ncbi:hypothetical protein [Tranquillimonas rosea]|uniref:hypothetical protein n=1 Tax=Tranquillimonas rosea TaxID=641238 RepID=UPI003BAA50A9
MKYQVHNPTSRKKAVRAAGGFTVVEPGGKATIDAEWTEGELARYERAGLKVKQASAAPQGGQKKPDDGAKTGDK